MKRNGRRGPVRICLMGLAAAGTVWGAVYMIKNSRAVLTAVPWEQQVRMAGEELAALLWHQAAPYEMTGKNSRNITEQDGSNTDQAVKIAWEDADPVFRNHMQARLFYREHQYLDRYGDETTGRSSMKKEKRPRRGAWLTGLEESPAESFGEGVRGNRSQCFRLCPFPGRKPSSAGNRNTLSASAAGGF